SPPRREPPPRKKTAQCPAEPPMLPLLPVVEPPPIEPLPVEPLPMDPPDDAVDLDDDFLWRWCARLCLRPDCCCVLSPDDDVVAASADTGTAATMRASIAPEMILFMTLLSFAVSPETGTGERRRREDVRAPASVVKTGATKEARARSRGGRAAGAVRADPRWSSRGATPAARDGPGWGPRRPPRPRRSRRRRAATTRRPTRGGCRRRHPEPTATPSRARSSRRAR